MYIREAFVDISDTVISTNTAGYVSKQRTLTITARTILVVYDI